jgi:hypothetical protein
MMGSLGSELEHCGWRGRGDREEKKIKETSSKSAQTKKKEEKNLIKRHNSTEQIKKYKKRNKNPEKQHLG